MIMAADLGALVRFHCYSSVPTALRLQAPLVGAAIAGIAMGPDPGATLAALAGALAASGLGPAPLVAVVLALSLARAAARPAAGAFRGWARSLPASARDHRLAGTIAVAIAIGPLLAALALLLGSASALEQGAAGVRLAALPLLGWSAALQAWPSRRRGVVMPLAILAALASFHGSWIGWIAALGLAVAALLAGGDSRRVAVASRAAGGTLATARPARLAWRSLGASAAGAWAAAAVPLIATALLRANNPGLGSTKLALAERLGALAALALAAWILSSLLATRRAPWPWARALPTSSWRRAGEEACVVGALALPVVAAGMLLFDAISALPAALALPWLALRAAAWSRPQARTPQEDQGFAAAEAALTACGIALLPLLAVLAVAALPLAALIASRRDRAWRVTAWDELRAAHQGDAR